MRKLSTYYAQYLLSSWLEIPYEYGSAVPSLAVEKGKASLPSLVVSVLEERTEQSTAVAFAPLAMAVLKMNCTHSFFETNTTAMRLLQLQR